MENVILPCGQLIGLLLFCVLFLKLNTFKTELARLVMGTIFLVITNNRNNIYCLMKKGYVGMAKHFSKKYGVRILTTCNPMSRCLSALDATSLHH